MVGFKRSLTVLAAATALASATSYSLAADAVLDEVEPTPPVVQPYNWTGFHLGVGAGYGGAQHNSGFEIFDRSLGGLLQVGPIDLFSIGAEVDFGGDGALATVEGGFDYQFGNKFVVGVQADFTRADINTRASIFGDVCYESPAPNDDCDTATVSDTPKIGYTLQAKDSWSVLGRIGYVANGYSLLYGVGGYTETQMEADLVLNSLPTGSVPLASYSYEREAATYGVGIESVISGGLTAKLEYRHTSWDNTETIPFGPEQGVRFWDDSTIQTIRGVVSYRFGGDNDGVTGDELDGLFDWTGFRLGATAGFGTATHNRGLEIYDYSPGGLLQIGPFDLFSIGGNVDLGADGKIGSVEAGYDHQLGEKFVIGIQADYTFSDVKNQASIFGDVCYEGLGPDDCDTATVSDTPDITYTLNTGDSWSVIGRAGWLANPATLIYGLAGYTNQEMHADIQLNSIPFSAELTSYSYERDGWTFGAGMETMLTEKLSAKLEYRNMSWDKNTDQSIGFAGLRETEDSMIQTFRAGLSWRLN